MKIYRIKYNFAKPADQAVTVNALDAFQLKIELEGRSDAESFTVSTPTSTDGGAVFSDEGNLTWQCDAAAEGLHKYTSVASNGSESVEITVVITAKNSASSELASSGGTSAGVSRIIAGNNIKVSASTGNVTISSVIPENYKTYDDTKIALSADGYAMSYKVDGLVNDVSTTIEADITTLGNSVYTKSETSSATEIATGLASAGKVKTVNHIEPDASGNIQISASSGSAGYPLVEVEAVTAEEGLSCKIDNQTVSYLTIDDAETAISIYLPAETSDDTARDFILRIENTAVSAANVVFTSIDPDEEVSYESTNTSWAVVKPGVNIITFTETKRV